MFLGHEFWALVMPQCYLPKVTLKQVGIICICYDIQQRIVFMLLKVIWYGWYLLMEAFGLLTLLISKAVFLKHQANPVWIELGVSAEHFCKAAKKFLNIPGALIALQLQLSKAPRWQQKKAHATHTVVAESGNNEDRIARSLPKTSKYFFVKLLLSVC